jgi:CxxC motif-containing protein
MKAINTTVAPDGIRIGDVVIKNVAGTDTDILATSNY